MKNFRISEQTGKSVPFREKELLRPRGLYYGVNAISQNMIMANRLTGYNPNGLILGVPGRGMKFRNGMPDGDYLSLNELCEWMDLLLSRYVCLSQPMRVCRLNAIYADVFELP